MVIWVNLKLAQHFLTNASHPTLFVHFQGLCRSSTSRTAPQIGRARAAEEEGRTQCHNVSRATETSPEDIANALEAGTRR